MNTHTKRVTVRLLGTLLVAASLVQLTSAQQGIPSRQTRIEVVGTRNIPVEDFFKLPTFSSALLSPQGTHVAYVREVHGRRNLAVMDIASRKREFLTNYNDADVSWFRWLNNDRLIFTIDDLKASVEEDTAGGLRAINKDGSEARILTEATLQSGTSRLLGTSRGLSARAAFGGTVKSGDLDDFIAFETFNSPLRTTISRANTKSGRVTSIAGTPPGNVLKWVLDSHDVPRAIETLDGDKSAVYVRQGVADSWKKVTEYSSYSGQGYSPVAFGPDDTLYVAARLARDTAAIHRFDWQKLAPEAEPLLALKDFDLATEGSENGGLVFDSASKALLGIRFNAQRRETFWFDAAMRKWQQTVDAALPGRANQIQGSPTNSVLLVASWADTSPAKYYLLDTKATKLTQIGVQRPWVAEDKAAQVDFIRYKARDGLSIPALVTYPVGVQRKNLPLVVLAHGGPYVRGMDWGWDAEPQFLASRGFVVLEPEFRGSTSHGWNHYKAGWKQWGLAMQDDLQDGVKHLVEQGIVDPKRVCIAGASYGGYATVMGLIKHPETYKCGISWVGVTDIDLMYSVGWSDTADSQWAKFGMPVLVADRDKDSEQIKATSAVEQSSRLRAPLILAYGTADVRVPYDHGKKLVNRIKGHNPDVEYIEYPGEGHGWRKLSSNVDFWTRVEKFLDRYIGDTTK